VSSRLDEWLAVSVEALLSEIERYLGAVDEFRRAGCEPLWQPEAGDAHVLTSVKRG
jgi:hypothetical protein